MTTNNIKPFAYLLKGCGLVALVLLLSQPSKAGTVHYTGNFVVGSQMGDLVCAAENQNGGVDWSCNPTTNTCFVCGPGGWDGYWEGVVYPPPSQYATSGTSDLVN